MKKQLLLLYLIVIVLRSLTFAQQDLEAERKRVLGDALRRNFPITQCCNSSLKSCLDKKNPCPLALYLNPFVDWIVTKESDYGKLYEQLGKRYESFTSKEVFSIDTTVVKWLGDSAAPVNLEVYFSASCPHCWYILSELHNAIVDGELKGKARMTEVPFGTNIANLAMMIANSYDKFWEFILLTNKTKERIDTTNIREVLKTVGLTQEQIDNKMGDKQLRIQLNKCKQEAIANSVTVTPTIFINNHRYSSYKDPQWIIDAVKFEYEAHIR